MRLLKSSELRKLYLDFFREKGHAIIPSASLIPENDPTVLYTTAGMHPLVPYLMGAKHPEGTRLADVQKCIRTGDIDEVGDTSHCTFFEMLGNWSLGDYFKKESIAYSWEFLTSDKWLGIDKDKLYFTCFAGDADAPRDTYSHDRWVEMGVDPSHIFYLDKKHNWWGPAGITGPCGPDTEIFYDTGKPKCCPECNPSCDCGKYLEIWNNVFMEYNKQADGSYLPLAQHNVDTGMGLDRTIATLQGVESVYDTDAFTGIIKTIEELSGKHYKDSPEITRAFRIVADHIRCATFILGDPRGVTPSNVDQGYILRRLIRRAIRFAMQLGIPDNKLDTVADAVIAQYGEVYPELTANREKIMTELDKEETRFQKALRNGTREFERIKGSFENGTIDGATAFHLYDTFGFPIEFTEELAKENGLRVDVEGFKAAFEEHQKKSQAGAEQRFKGGLADTSLETARLHSATHLLQKALREVLGTHVEQAGSFNNQDKLRFDFTHFSALSKEELKQVENIVNEKIAECLPVVAKNMPIEEARKTGAAALFGEKYGDVVRVVSMGDFSVEFCGGTHVSNTGVISALKIISETGVAAGVRRIEALTSKGLLKYYDDMEKKLQEAAALVKATPNQLSDKIRHLQAENKNLHSELESVKSKMAKEAMGDVSDQVTEVKGVKLIAAKVDDVDMNGLRDLGDQLKEKLGEGVIVLASVAGGKVSLVAMATDEAVKKGAHAGNLIKGIAGLVGGGGGGRPNMAQAGGKNPDGIDAAIAKVSEVLESQL